MSSAPDAGALVLRLSPVFPKMPLEDLTRIAAALAAEHGRLVKQIEDMKAARRDAGKRMEEELAQLRKELASGKVDRERVGARLDGLEGCGKALCM